jgi:hypothetical protein
LVVVERERGRRRTSGGSSKQAGRQAGCTVCISLMAAALTCDLEAGRRHRHASTCHTPRIGTALCLKSVPSSHATSQEIPRLNCSILGSESRSPVSSTFAALTRQHIQAVWTAARGTCSAQNMASLLAGHVRPTSSGPARAVECAIAAAAWSNHTAKMGPSSPPARISPTRVRNPHSGHGGSKT